MQHPCALFNPIKMEDTSTFLMVRPHLFLVDMTGRILRDDKRGAISAHLPPILERLEINQEE
jgi:hypothetical protein